MLILPNLAASVVLACKEFMLILPNLAASVVLACKAPQSA